MRSFLWIRNESLKWSNTKRLKNKPENLNIQAVEKQKYEIAAKLIQLVAINTKEYPKI